jgi:tRNA(Arg) A34 adenosine deaminase TadA
MSLDKYYLGLAIKAAKENKINHLPRMAAIIVTKESKFFIGRNQYKTHPLQARFGRNPQSIYLHAEIDAIVQAIRSQQDIADSSIYVARVMKNNEIALAKPCHGCLGAILYYGVKNVLYTSSH